MAKQAKEREAQEITTRAVKSLVKKIGEHFANIDSAKARYANASRRERDAMTVLYEAAAQEGIPQNIAKLHIKIVRGIEKIKGYMTELDAAEQAVARKVSKADGSKMQLALWADLPVLKVPKSKAEPAEPPAAEAKTKRKGKGNGATGEDIAEADAAQEQQQVNGDDGGEVHETQPGGDSHPLH